MSRLASFQGPSSPSPNPIRNQPPTSPSSSTPGRQSKSRQPKSPKSRDVEPSIYALDIPNTTPPTETTYHRKLRNALVEMRSTMRTWNELVLMDGVKAIKGLIDARTELDNALGALPQDVQPRVRIVTLKLDIMEKRLEELRVILAKLEKQFQKMASIVESLEALLFDAVKAKGWMWVNEEPLWTTWSLERFVSRAPTLLPPYHRAIAMCQDIANQLQSNSILFEDSRTALRQWIAQPCLYEGRWEEWNEICGAEVQGWGDTRN